VLTLSPKADWRLTTQFLPFSRVLHFTKSSLSACREFLIKADRQQSTQLQSLSGNHQLPETGHSIKLRLWSEAGPKADVLVTE
jgi:hypothetical protein